MINTPILLFVLLVPTVIALGLWIARTRDLRDRGYPRATEGGPKTVHRRRPSSDETEVPT